MMSHSNFGAAVAIVLITVGRWEIMLVEREKSCLMNMRCMGNGEIDVNLMRFSIGIEGGDVHN